MPMIFEPFTGKSFAKLANENYYALHTDLVFWGNSRPFLDYFIDVLNGKNLRGQHLFQNNYFINKSGPAVIKFVNRTELIPALYANYRTEAPFVYLFRDPISVLKSRISYGKAMIEEKPLDDKHKAFRQYFQYLPTNKIPWHSIKTNYELDVFKVYAHLYLVKNRFKNIPLCYLDYDELKAFGSTNSKTALKREFGLRELSAKSSSSARKSTQSKDNRALGLELIERLQSIKCIMTILRGDSDTRMSITRNCSSR